MTGKIPDTTPAEPSDLMRLAPESAIVTIRGRELTVYAVSAATAARLIARFPDFQNIITGRGMRDASPMAFITAMPEIVAAIIAAGCGHADDSEAEAKAATLSLTDQLSLFGEILRLTMPEGVPAFMNRVATLTKAAGVRKPTAPPNRAQRRAAASNGKVH